VCQTLFKGIITDPLIVEKNGMDQGSEIEVAVLELTVRESCLIQLGMVKRCHVKDAVNKNFIFE
jgi:hypothetical protein